MTNITPLRTSRTYLDECRAKGIHQQREEQLAEEAEMATILANLQRQNTAKLHKFSDRSSKAGGHANAVEAAVAEFRDRCEQILEVYDASGLGSLGIGFLRHVIFKTSFSPEDAASAFSALSLDTKDQTVDQ